MLESISLYRLELPLTVPYKLAFGDVRHFDTVLVLATGVDGQVGVGEATILTGYTEETIDGSWLLAKKLARQILEGQFADIDRVLAPHLVEAPFTATALLTAIDMIRSPELYAVDQDKKVPILGIMNASTGPEILSECDQLIEQGFRTIKVKVGFDVQKDLKKLEAAQAATSGRALIRIDGNQGFSQSQAAEFIRGLNPQGIELFEQPCHADDWDSALKAALISPVDMMLDESIYGLDDIRRAKELNAAKFIKVKLMKFGTIKNLVDSILLIKKLGMKAVLGNGVATDIGCWMEAIVAARHIDNAGEMNGFLKPKNSILINPLSFNDGSIELHKDYKPILNMDVVEASTIDSENIKNLHS
jgi:L-alanine-DL-glutamate epimerase-like enolase superfamily enzyme